MWGQGETAGFGGGFMAGSTDSPAGGEKQGKGRRTQNIIPVCVKQLLECREESFKLEGFEAHVVSLVGLVREVETTTTKMSMYIEDQTGTIECVNYIGTDGDSNAEPNLLCEGSYGRIVGALRTTKGQKYVIIFKSDAVTDLNEITSHALDVVHTSMKLKRLRSAEDSKPAAGTALDNTFSNSMIKDNFGGKPAGGGAGGLKPKQNLLLRIVSSCHEEAGMSKEHILASVRSHMTEKEALDILEDLGNEGLLFSTIDEDHFKCTDSQFL